MTHIVYGYGQASYDPSVPSTDDQEARVRDAAGNLLREGVLSADCQWGGFVRDEATQKPAKFAQRYGGSILLAGLHPRDIVISTSHDRIFSSVVDASETLEALQKLSCRLILLDDGLDTGKPEKALLPLAAMMKHLRQRERRRTKEEFDYRKRQGMPAGGKSAIGWEIVRAKLDGSDKAYFVPDHGARRVAQFIAEHYDQWHGTFEQTAYWLNAQKVFRPDGKPWRRTAVYNWYRAAKENFPLPNGRHEAHPIPAGSTLGEYHRRIVPDDDD
jgi:DNA invertase Pin-like site-specific DNA recombinase